MNGLKDKKYIFLMIFLILGLLLSLQFRSTLSASRERVSNTLDVEEIINQIEEEKKIESQLKERIEASLKQKEDFIAAYFEKRNDVDLKGEWDSIRLKAGLVDVKGPGIIIRLDDAESRIEGDPQFLIIHDQDIRIILNELKNAGAQAISINGERITGMSELICAGPTILINRNRYAVPYVINAIGDPDVLFKTVDSSERIALMRHDRIRVEIKKENEVYVPRFRDIDHIDLINAISGLEVVNNENS
ncbi:MAG: DUF881 domain-containing protein [Acetivibrionales bacterium]